MGILRKKQKFIFSLLILVAPMLLLFQNCSSGGTGSTAGGSNNISSTTPYYLPFAIQGQTMTKVAVGAACSFVLFNSGAVAFFGNAAQGCYQNIENFNPQNVTAATPSIPGWLGTNIADIQLSTFSQPEYLTKSSVAMSMFDNTTLLTDVKSLVLGSFSRHAFIKNDGSYITGEGVNISAFKNVTTAIFPYSCEYMNCAIVGSDLQCSDADLANCSGGVFSPPTDLHNLTSIVGVYNTWIFAISNGAVFQFGSPSTAVSSLTSGVTSMSASSNSACAVKGGNVWCWGDNTYGQLGDGTKTNRTSPVLVPGLSGVVQVSVALDHTCALTSSQSVWCWGAGTSGQLGDGHQADSLAPVKAAF